MTQAAKHISHAFWKSRDSGLIILASDWRKTDELPPLFLGPADRPFAKLEQLEPEECGRYCRYFKQDRFWVFTIQTKRYPELLDRKARIFLAGDFNEWSEAIGHHEWELLPSDESAETTFTLKVAAKKLPTDHCAQFKFVTQKGVWLDVPDSAPNAEHSDFGGFNFKFDPAQSGQHMFRFQTPLGYEPVGDESIVYRLPEGEEVRKLPNTQFLSEAQTDLPLGAMVEAGQTTFRLFAPRAERVQVAYGNTVESAASQIVDMASEEGMTWAVTIDADLDGHFYNFRVSGDGREGTTHFDGLFPVLDPYAKACVGHRGPGIVVKPERLAKVADPYEPPAWHDLVILEGHVRDLAAHAPVVGMTPAERKGYAGLRKWIQAEGSYLKEIGVNAIELQPIQEFDNRHPEDYHWGYMTVNYFAPESSYAQAPEQASQIEEFKGLVSDFHDAGMAVILDVVYNHVGEPNHLLFIDKFYYFHLDDANDLINWSGCGNDLRCDTPMARRLIIESLTHLIETYDVDGFRFDLAELIGIDVLREIEVELKKIKPSLILIAEPWSFRGHIQDELKETGYASWNDGYRESIADYVCGKGNQDMIRYFLSGSPSSTRFVAQSINYTESHDDHCWLDRITERPNHDASDPTMLDRRRTHLMAAVLFSSLGVPMLAEGQDFLRSKKGISNTYQRGDINALDYNQRLVYSGTHDYFASWIHFRLSSLGQAFRYDGGLEEGYFKYGFADGFSAIVALYNADQSRDAPRLVFAVNPHLEYASVVCPEIAALPLVQIADQERFDVHGLKSALIPRDANAIHLPPLSCGLWLVN